MTRFVLALVLIISLVCPLGLPKAVESLTGFDGAVIQTAHAAKKKIKKVKRVKVKGYYKKNGTYVKPHTRVVRR